MSLPPQSRIVPIPSWSPVARFSSLIVALSLLGCSSGSSNESEQGGQKADRIVVVKSNHTMTLMESGRVLKVYKVALGRGSAGPKGQMDDNKTPEGEYLIDQKNAKS